jgi:murein DD-endopeptidase MepM/ murein hydrolase activator NlpD
MLKRNASSGGRKKKPARFSSYSARGAKWRKFRKYASELIQKINNKGHEHITLMIASHSANTPVFTMRISKYIILFITCVLIVTISFAVSAIANKRISDPEIAYLDLQVRMQEEMLEQFVRNVEKLDSGMREFVSSLRSIVGTTSSQPHTRLRLFSGASSYPDGRDTLSQESIGFNNEIRLLDSINLNVLRAEQQVNRLRVLILALRPHIRFPFFRHRERSPVGEYPNFWPVDNGGAITSPFGPRRNPYTGEYAHHNGIDIAHYRGTVIRAAFPGEVTRVDNQPRGYGLYIEIKHEDGYSTRYAHLDTQEVFKGDIVYQGQIIGRMGRTGRTTGVHLHYEILKDGEFLNPGGHMDHRFDPRNLPQP